MTERSLAEIEMELNVVEGMVGYHDQRLCFYRNRKNQLQMEWNRARRLEREAKELQK